MKGTPQEVRCGFSKKAVELLQSKNVRFGSFDILSDDDVCEGLTVYSKWPTYPQLYINGELIGGYDILKELIETGEFDSMIPKKEDTVDRFLIYNFFLFYLFAVLYAVFFYRIKRLISQHKIVLFMKGNIREPKCGFSRQIVEILNETGYALLTLSYSVNKEIELMYDF
jgi:Grx4 family monothiol glutaredoxin